MPLCEVKKPKLQPEEKTALTEDVASYPRKLTTIPQHDDKTHYLTLKKAQINMPSVYGGKCGVEMVCGERRNGWA